MLLREDDNDEQVGRAISPESALCSPSLSVTQNLLGRDDTGHRIGGKSGDPLADSRSPSGHRLGIGRYITGLMLMLRQPLVRRLQRRLHP